MVWHSRDRHDPGYFNRIDFLFPKEDAICPYRDQIRQDIDTIMKKPPTDFNAFLRKMEEMGYEVKRGKYASVKGKDQRRFVRFHSLGEGYSEEDIQAVIAGEKKHRARIKSPLAKEDRAFHLLLIIDDKIRAKGPGYQQWATNYNLKQMAKTRIFLKEPTLTPWMSCVRKQAPLPQTSTESTKN